MPMAKRFTKGKYLITLLMILKLIAQSSTMQTINFYDARCWKIEGIIH